MKNIIKQILKEETSGLSDAEKDTAYKVMNNLTKGYYWYHDTPEQPFDYSEGSIWLINPKTEQWILELTKSGELWYHIKTSNTFYKFLNMEKSDFKSFIKIWVEDVLERGVVSTNGGTTPTPRLVKDVLNNGKQMT